MDEKTKELLLTLIKNLSEPEYITQRESGEPCIKGKNLRFLKEMIERMQFMKIWVDDVRPAPEGYVWCKSVNETKYYIEEAEWYDRYIVDSPIELIDLDYDSGDYEKDGGPYIKLMDWLVERGTLYPLAFHSQNCVGMEYMKRMYRRYWLGESL